MSIYRWLISLLVWLSADPQAVDLERPKAAAAVAAARASMEVEARPAPSPAPAKCGECKGTGYLVMPDGHRVKCPKCGGSGNCPDGTCPRPKPKQTGEA